MTTSAGGSLTLASQSQQAPYTPSPWGDFFLHHIPCTPSQYSVMKDKAKLKKEEVKTMLLDMDSFDLLDKLEFIDTLERLGLGHHYIKEILELLSNVYKVNDRDLDLPTTSLRFYLLRKHGYHISSDIFLKFRDDKGDIVSNDARSLLRLYDAAHLRVHGEEILDDILTSSKIQLECTVENLVEPVLKEEVEYALNTPRFRRLNRVEASEYISLYEKKTTYNDAALEFAKLDFNILLTLYCKELKELTLWWMEFQMQANTSNYAGDRIVEMQANHIYFFFLKREEASKNMASTLQACAREFGITIEQAIEKLRGLIEEAWMDITEECPRQQQPMVGSSGEGSQPGTWTMDFLYKDADGYTDSYSIKDTLDSLYVNLVH